jgi:hypothetical protein
VCLSELEYLSAGTLFKCFRQNNLLNDMNSFLSFSGYDFDWWTKCVRPRAV